MKSVRVMLLALLLMLLSASVHAAPRPSASPTPSPAPPAGTTESFFSMLLRITGISATPRNVRDDSIRKAGQVWVAFLNNNTRRRVATNDTGFRSPVFFPNGESILVLQGNKVVKLSITDDTKKDLFEIKGIIKLIGFDTKDPDKVLMLSDEDQDACPTVGLLSLATGKVAPQAYGKGTGDQVFLASLEGALREYEGGKFAVDTATQVRTAGNEQLRWQDVVFIEKDKPDVNVSKCEPKNCVQPSLSDDRKRVVYIKEP